MRIKKQSILAPQRGMAQYCQTTSGSLVKHQGRARTPPGLRHWLPAAVTLPSENIQPCLSEWLCGVCSSQRWHARYVDVYDLVPRYSAAFDVRRHSNKNVDTDDNEYRLSIIITTAVVKRLVCMSVCNVLTVENLDLKIFN